MIVILNEKAFIFNFVTLKLIEQVDTYPNPAGLCALSQAEKPISKIICLPHQDKGSLKVLNYGKLLMSNMGDEAYKLLAISYLTILCVFQAETTEMKISAIRHIFSLPFLSIIKNVFLFLIFCAIVVDKSIDLVIPAHDTEVGAIAVNPDGTLIASASERGHIIKIYSTDAGEVV